MLSDIAVNSANSNDYEDLGMLMFDAVRHGRSMYTEAQRSAWMPQPPSGQGWKERLDSQSVYVARDRQRIVGFISLTETGYVDFVFISPSHQGTGIFRSLYQKVEELAHKNGLERIWVHASLTAQAPFKAMGFRVVKREIIERVDQCLERLEMEKFISDS